MSKLKLTKNVIKDIVKECLVEILSEGLLANKDQSTVSEARRKPVNESSERRSRRLKELKTDHKTNAQKPNTKLNELASSLTQDPILADMLKDTANTTLQEQISAESRKNSLSLPPGSGDQAQKAVDSSNPEELFGAETSGKWAQLAFGG